MDDETEELGEFGFISGRPLDEETIKALGETLRRQLKNSLWERQRNPTKFPRHVKVTDERALMLFAERAVKRDKLLEVRGEMEALLAEGKAIQERLFHMLRKLYPEISVLGEEGVVTGFRKWRGDWWYVGWDLDTGDEE